MRVRDCFGTKKAGMSPLNRMQLRVGPQCMHDGIFAQAYSLRRVANE